MVTGRRWGHKVSRQGYSESQGAKQGSEHLAWPWLNLALLPLELQKDDHLMLDAGLWCSGFQAAVSGFRTVSAFSAEIGQSGIQSCRKGS